MRRAGAIVTACLALAAGSARAGPCVTCGAGDVVGWWDDRALAAGETADRAPRVEVDGDGTTSRVAITWERERGVAVILGETWLALSDDGGCTWSSRRVGTGSADERLPDVALSRARGVVAVAWSSDGDVVVAMSLDDGRTFASAQLVGTAAVLDAVARPRIAMIPVGGDLHVHVAWSDGGTVRLASSRSSGATGSWTEDSTLAARLAGWSSWQDVDVAADTRSVDPAIHSAVTLVGAALAPGSTTLEVFALRSNDSGTTFHGNPEEPSTLDVPARVSEPRPLDDPSGPATGPALDVSDDGTGEFYAWEAVLYTDVRDGPGARFDARAEEGAGPSTIAEWNGGPSPDPIVMANGYTGAVAVIPNPLQRPPSPEMHLFVEGEVARTRESFHVRGSLDASASPALVETCALAQLTGLAPPRAAGDVAWGSVAADEDLSHVFVAWADTRAGGSSIWWKRTDTQTAPPTAVQVGPGDCATGGGIAIEWQLPASPPHCDVARVRVEWGLAPDASGGEIVLPATTRTQIAGLAPGLTWHVRVTVVDEACNEAAAPVASGSSASCGGGVACPNPVGASVRARRAPAPDDVELSWGPPPVDATHDAATSYDIHRSMTRPDAGFLASATASPGTTWADLGAAAPGGALLHFYLVVARNACGTSGDEPAP